MASNDSAGGVPFAISFDRSGKRMLVAEAEKSTVTTYQVRRDGKLKVLQEPLASGQETLCWLERAGNYFYGGNTGNSTVTGYRMDKHRALSLTNSVGIATPPSATSQGVIDLAVTEDEKFVSEGLPAFDESGMEGIAAI
ncbi:hypothetical protein ACF1G5_36755 [Streptomyces coeruleorubidus]|uniref:hypothetical protein n=1 Tax=Streptomyces coeruleorubidus TaxID=116188 RepID=UPI0036FB7C78